MIVIAVVVVGLFVSAFLWLNAILGVVFPETGGSSFAREFRFYVALLATIMWLTTWNLVARLLP